MQQVLETCFPTFIHFLLKYGWHQIKKNIYIKFYLSYYYVKLIYNVEKCRFNKQSYQKVSLQVIVT